MKAQTQKILLLAGAGVVGLFLLTLARRGGLSSGAQQINEAVPLDGSNVMGQLWHQLSGANFGGAHGGVNAPPQFLTATITNG